MTVTSDHHPNASSIHDDLRNVSPDPDPETVAEVDDLNKQQKETLLHGLRQDIDERKKYAAQIFWLTAAWLGLMGCVLLAQGFNYRRFDLRENVLIAVVTTTTTGILGLLILVTKYLFPQKP